MQINPLLCIARTLAQIQKKMKNLKTNIIFKVAIIIIIALLLLIPTTMLKDLIRERENIQISAISEVSEKWGENQTITGPYISVPYDKYVKQFSSKDSVEKIVKLKKWLHFLPHDLTISGDISPEKGTEESMKLLFTNLKLIYLAFLIPLILINMILIWSILILTRPLLILV